MEKNLIFIGMIGSNTKAVAAETAQMLGRKFVDTDEVLTRNSGMSLHDLYMLLPIDAFKDLTLRLARQLSESDNYVIAVGDSILKNIDAISILKSTAYSVYIQQNIESIVDSCADPTHPLLARGLERLYELFNERQQAFEEYSDKIIEYSEDAAQFAVTAYKALTGKSVAAGTSNPALKAFFKYYLETLCPEADKDSFADECADAVNKILEKYIQR